jgi:hypothetical protein
MNSPPLSLSPFVSPSPPRCSSNSFTRIS